MSLTMGQPKERAMVFVDGNNLSKGLKLCYGIERLDLEPFCRHVVREVHVDGAGGLDNEKLTSQPTCWGPCAGLPLLLTLNNVV